MDRTRRGVLAAGASTVLLSLPGRLDAIGNGDAIAGDEALSGGLLLGGVL